jgi:colanic acid/amylovoran biosynthesis glycosyltransferase
VDIYARRLKNNAVTHEDGKSGFLVPEKDADTLAEKLTYLIEHPEIWPEMGKAGRTYVEQHYDIEKLNDQLVLLYHRLLEDGKTISTKTASIQNNS